MPYDTAGFANKASHMVSTLLTLGNRLPFQERETATLDHLDAVFVDLNSVPLTNPMLTLVHGVSLEDRELPIADKKLYSENQQDDLLQSMHSSRAQPPKLIAH